MGKRSTGERRTLAAGLVAAGLVSGENRSLVETARLQGRFRGRRAALAVTVAGAAVAAYLGWGYWVDSWWIWKLQSTNRTTRNLAAEKLAERKCIRAVPAIWDLILSEDSEEGIRPTIRTIPYSWEGTPLVLTLWQMGEAALPSIEQCVQGAEIDGIRIRLIVDVLRNRDIPIKLWDWHYCKGLGHCTWPPDGL